MVQNLNNQKIKKGFGFRPFEAALLVFVFVFGGYLFIPHTAEAFSFGDWLLPATLGGAEAVAAQNENRLYGELPEAIDAQPKQTFKIVTTAYSSEVGQTDSTPFTTASGTTVRRGVVAANFLPIGTKVRLPDLFGDEVFVVEDRMNARYDKRIDIWMEETADAKNFGVQWTTVEVF